MASLIFAQAKSIRRKALQQKSIMRNTFENLGTVEENKTYIEGAYNMIVDCECKEFIEICKIAKKLHEIYKIEIGMETYNWYHISIRPDDKKILFEDFYENVRKLVSRKCFKRFHLVFEQKSIEGEEVGKGFHCHIVGDMLQASKGEVLRDIKSTFNKMIKEGQIAENCIQVDPTRNPDEIVEKYLTAYESADGHKELTKITDKIWREKMNLEDYYNSVPAVLSIKSVRQHDIVNNSMLQAVQDKQLIDRIENTHI